MSSVEQKPALLGDETDKKPVSPTIGVLLSRISDQIRGLILGEIELAKLKITGIIRGALVAIISLVIATVLALYALGFLLAGAATGLQATGLPLWGSLLIVGLVLLVFAFLLVLVAKIGFSRMPKDLPNPKDNIQSAVTAVKEGWQHNA